MNKTEMINQISAKTNLTKKDSENALNAFIETVIETLKSGHDLQLMGLGSFKVKLRAARAGRNPKTGEPIKIAAAKLPSFKAGKALKEAVDYH